MTEFPLISNEVYGLTVWLARPSLQ